jgi:hypothetical protein
MKKPKRLLVARIRRGPTARMTKAEMRSALLRAIVIEYQNGKAKPFPCWGWERPTSMYVLRRRRLLLAKTYAITYEPVSDLLFQRQLPRGKKWPGTRLLLSAPVFSWVDGVWTQVECTLPCNRSLGADMQQEDAASRQLLPAGQLER